MSAVPAASSMSKRLAGILAGGINTNDSVADAYDQANGGTDDGADLATITTAIANVGVAPATLVPEWEIPTESAHPGLAATRAGNRLTKADFLPTEADVLAAAAAGKPILFGTIVTNAFEPDNSGYIAPYTGRQEGGHALLICGVRPHGNRHDYRVRNSWGTTWADQGNCWLDQSWVMPEVYGEFAYSQNPKNSRRRRPRGHD